MASGDNGSVGNFKHRLRNVDDITIRDFSNPWNFYSLFLSDNATVNNWCRNNGLLATTLRCKSENITAKCRRQGGGDVVCNGIMYPKPRGDKPSGEIFRCEYDRDSHTKAARTYSFFENSKLPIQDIMVFLKSYLDKSSLLQCSIFAGIAYKTTAVNWASYTRELFKEHFHTNIRHRKLSGEIEIDESLFGRRVKHNRGDPNKGLRVWVFGMIERSSNTIIIYPVQNRTAETLIPLIQRHVVPGSTIYSDGWGAYLELNKLGYAHFTVIHKYSFKKSYKNTVTGEIVTVHTNTMEGAWTHMKNHFKRMSGTLYTQFEGHIAEIMWRSEAKGDVYQSFFDLIRSIYTLDKAPVYNYTTPLFDTLLDPNIPVEDIMVHPAPTDAETEAESESALSDNPPGSAGSQTSNQPESLSGSAESYEFPPNLPVDRPPEPTPDLDTIISLSSGISISDDEHDTTLIGAEGGAELPSSPVPRPNKPSWVTSRRKKKATKSKTTKEKVCCPPFFEENTPQPARRRQRRRQENPYEKEAFQLQFSSSDDDFQ